MRTKWIILPYGGKKRLAKKFNVSEQAVYDALNFKTNSTLAQQIRETALLWKGVIIEISENMPNNETSE